MGSECLFERSGNTVSRTLKTRLQHRWRGQVVMAADAGIRELQSSVICKTMPLAASHCTNPTQKREEYSLHDAVRYEDLCIQLPGPGFRLSSRALRRQLPLFLGRCAACGRQPHEHLKIVVDHPLQTSERSNHEDPNREPIPESSEPNVFVDTARCASKAFAGLAIGVELRNHDICRVRDDGTQDTSNVTTCEGHGRLCAVSVVGFLAWKMIIDLFHDCFKRGELQIGQCRHAQAAHFLPSSWCKGFGGPKVGTSL